MIQFPTIGRRHFLAGTTALASLSMTGASAFAQAPKRGGTLKMSVDQAVNKLNPLLTRVNPEYLVGELLYSNLTRLGVDMSPQPDLAESWSSSADLTEWTFKLRKGVTFHDGSPCTASDVVATFEAILDPKTASPARQNVGPLEKVAAAGRHHRGLQADDGLRRPARDARLHQRQDRAGRRDQSRLGASRPRGHRHRAVQAGFVRARAADRSRAQPDLLRSRSAPISTASSSSSIPIRPQKARR